MLQYSQFGSVSYLLHEAGSKMFGSLYKVNNPSQTDMMTTFRPFFSLKDCYGTIASKINVTPKAVRLLRKLQLSAALCNEI